MVIAAFCHNISLALTDSKESGRARNNDMFRPAVVPVADVKSNQILPKREATIWFQEEHDRTCGWPLEDVRLHFDC